MYACWSVSMCYRCTHPLAPAATTTKNGLPRDMATTNTESSQFRVPSSISRRVALPQIRTVMLFGPDASDRESGEESYCRQIIRVPRQWVANRCSCLNIAKSYSAFSRCRSNQVRIWRKPSYSNGLCGLLWHMSMSLISRLIATKL